MSSVDVSLRDPIDADLPVFFEQQLDPVATEMAVFPSRDREAFMAHWAKIMRDKSGVIQTIVADGQVAGNIVCYGPVDEREVGYWLGREFWGRGIATMALSQFLELVTARPLYGHVAKHNIGSIRVLQKCGFAIISEHDSAEEVTLKLDHRSRGGNDGLVNYDHNSPAR